MPTKIPPQLGAVQETLLITLYGRARESREPDGLLEDPDAERMMEALDYDFAQFEGAPAWVANLRTLLYDQLIGAFLAEHPAGTVVELGTGLNTRFERVDNGRLHWVDLDLPDVVALRRRFLPDNERRTTVDSSVMDEAWLERVAQLPQPWFFVAEGLLCYLTEHQVRTVVARLRDRFPGSQLLTDTVPRRYLDEQDRQGPLKDMAASKTWGCDDPREVESFAPGVILRRSASMMEMTEVRALTEQRRSDLEHYSDRLVHLYRLGEPRTP